MRRSDSDQTIGIQNGTRTIALQVVSRMPTTCTTIMDPDPPHAGLADAWLPERLADRRAAIRPDPDREAFNSTGIGCRGPTLGTCTSPATIPTRRARSTSRSTLQVITPTDAETERCRRRSRSGDGERQSGARLGAPSRSALPKRRGRRRCASTDVRGAVVRDLLRERAARPGYHVIGWDGRDQRGRGGRVRHLLRPHARPALERTMRVTMMR